jgi:hypothetical protein
MSALDARLMADIIHTLGKENGSMSGINSSSFIPTESGDYIRLLEHSPFPIQNTMSADPTPNETTSSPLPLTYRSETSLLDSVYSVFQHSTYHPSTLSSPSERFIHQKGANSHFEILFLMRHFAKFVGPWSVPT